MIPGYCMKQMGYNSVTLQEYNKITRKEGVTRIAQETPQ
jgi:hypothetical protein